MYSFFKNIIVIFTFKIFLFNFDFFMLYVIF